MGDVSVDEVFETYSQAVRLSPYTHARTPLPISPSALTSEPFAHTHELVQMRMLVDYYYTATLPGTDIPLSRLPLIVNTHGWLKGYSPNNAPQNASAPLLGRNSPRGSVGCCG